MHICNQPSLTASSSLPDNGYSLIDSFISVSGLFISLILNASMEDLVWFWKIEDLQCNFFIAISGMKMYKMSRLI